MWEELKQWIIRNGGYIHEGIQLVDENDTRTLQTTQAIPSNTTVMIIPSACIVTVPQEWRIKVQQATTTDSSKFYHPIDDLLVAWNLVVHQTTTFQMYWKSLAPKQILTALPRSWAIQTICLQGSPLLRRIQCQLQHLQHDYTTVLQILHDPEKKNVSMSNPPPSFDEFNQAMAIVTSRAFAGPSSLDNQQQQDTTTALSSACCVPSLDLCNHTRRPLVRPNLAYTWKSTTTDNHNPCNMVVQTRHAVDMPIGTSLCITYGAQSNAQLLLNYGFCLSQNIEPDGSSNNTYELHLKDGQEDATTSSAIILRLGPKSYTYGPLAQVLQALSIPSTQQDSGIINEEDSSGDNDNDMEAFLNECEDTHNDDLNSNEYNDDEDEDDEVDAFLYMESVTTNRHPSEHENGDDDDDENDDTTLKQQKIMDQQALKKFQMILMERLDAYPKVSVAQSADLRTQYAQILLESEQEILHFYHAVAQRLLARLTNDDDDDTSTTSTIPLTTQAQQHVDSLVEAFFQIRYTMF
jgi:hypothetical protein